MFTLREKFAALFGEDQVAAIERAGREHGLGHHDRAPKGIGSDEFRWCLVICIGYECMSRESFRTEHGITAPWEDLRAAIKAHAALNEHDGDLDHLSLFAGTYNEFMPDEQPAAEVV